jgi:Tol biopolymer transport system component
VRSELIGLQVRDGLTIASYGPRGLRIVDFEKRKALLGRPFPNHRAFGGTVSNDGGQVAFTLKSLSISPPLTLGVMKIDNSDLREFPSVRNPAEMCWSYDMSRIAMGIVNTRNTTLRVAVLNVATDSVQDLSSDIGRLTSQCWSPGGKEIVFESEGKVIVQNVEDGKQRMLAIGKVPTWSPDGNWIAFFDELDHSYYVIHPSGEGRKKLFHHRGAMAGLYWSPDSRIVAYVVEIGGFLSLEAYKLHVRRLEDGSEDWVDDSDLGCCEGLQWITNRALLSQLESEGSSE